MESYHPERLLVYYKFLKNFNLCRTFSTFGIGLLQDPPFYCKKICSIYNSVRRLLLLKIVLHSLFAYALYGLRPNSDYADPFLLICGGSICKKYLFFIQDGITLSRKSIPGHKSVQHIKVSLLQRENIKKKIEESFGIRMLFPKISAKMSIYDTVLPLQTIFA